MKKRQIYLLAVTLTALTLSACSTPKMLGNPQFPYPLAAKPEIGQIVHMPTGVLVEEQEMLEIVTQNRIVYVGETHDNPASHRLQLTILKAMAERFPGKVALGMEMFTPAQNEALARWVAGQSSEKEFLKEAGWYKVWKSDFEYYRDILLYARQEQIPVIGLNADKKTVRRVVANETEGLTPEESELIAQMDLSDPYHRGMVEGIYSGHVKSEGMLDGFHRAQALWDETMADSIVKFLQREDHEEFRMVVMAGGNHVRYGFGIPRRVFKRLPLSYTLVGGKEIEIPESKKDRLMDVTLPQFPMTPYDFLVFLEYEELEKEEVKLGVMLDDKDGQVVVKGVMPGSNAERAGIQEGDIIVSVDGEIVVENFDVVYEIKNKESGDIATLGVDRNGESKNFNIKLLHNNTDHPKHND